jgi:hypothetical protein
MQLGWGQLQQYRERQVETMKEITPIKRCSAKHGIAAQLS